MAGGRDITQSVPLDSHGTTSINYQINGERFSKSRRFTTGRSSYRTTFPFRYRISLRRWKRRRRKKKKERYEGEKERRKMIIVRLRTENHAARANDGRRHDKREIESFAIASFIANLFTKRDQLHLAQDIFLAQVSPFIFRCSRVAKSTAHG